MRESTLQIYRRRQCVNILYHTNLPPVAMREYPLYFKFTAIGNTLKSDVGNFTAVGNRTFAKFS